MNAQTKSSGNGSVDKEQRQRVGLRFLRGGKHGGRKDDRGGVVRKKGRDHHADQIHEHEELARRALRVIDREHRDPVEEPFAAPYFREQHHAEQEQIDVRALADGFHRQIQRQQPQRHQQHRAGHRPYRLGPLERTGDHAGGRERGDTP